MLGSSIQGADHDFQLDLSGLDYLALMSWAAGPAIHRELPEPGGMLRVHARAHQTARRHAHRRRVRPQEPRAHVVVDRPWFAPVAPGRPWPRPAELQATWSRSGFRGPSATRRRARNRIYRSRVSRGHTHAQLRLVVSSCNARRAQHRTRETGLLGERGSGRAGGHGSIFASQAAGRRADQASRHTTGIVPVPAGKSRLRSQGRSRRSSGPRRPRPGGSSATAGDPLPRRLGLASGPPSSVEPCRYSSRDRPVGDAPVAGGQRRLERRSPPGRRSAPSGRRTRRRPA